MDGMAIHGTFAENLEAFHKEHLEGNYEATFGCLSSLLNIYDRLMQNQDIESLQPQREILESCFLKFLTRGIDEVKNSVLNKSSIVGNELSEAEKKYKEFLRKRRLEKESFSTKNESTKASIFSKANTKTVLKWSKMVSMIKIMLIERNDAHLDFSTQTRAFTDAHNRFLISEVSEVVESIKASALSNYSSIEQAVSNFNYLFTGIIEISQDLYIDYFQNVEQEEAKVLKVDSDKLIQELLTWFVSLIKKEIDFNNPKIYSVDDLSLILELITSLVLSQTECSDELSACFQIFQEFSFFYFSVEQEWLKGQREKLFHPDRSFEFDHQSEGIVVHPLIENLFYVYKTATQRSLEIANSFTTLSLLNIVCHDMEDSLMPFLRRLLKPSSNTAFSAFESSKDQSEAEVKKFEEAFDSALTGNILISNILLYGINSSELSGALTKDLILLINKHFESNIESSLAVTLQQLKQLEGDMKSIVDQSIEEVFSSCFESKSSILYQNFSTLLLNLSYADEDISESRIGEFFVLYVYPDANIVRAREVLFPSCFTKLFYHLLGFILQRYIGLLLNTEDNSSTPNQPINFTEMGVLLVEEDILYLNNAVENLSEESLPFPQEIVKHLSILRQILLVLQIPSNNYLDITENHLLSVSEVNLLTEEQLESLIDRKK